MAQKYKSKWTGPQVDSAVDQITDKIDRSEIGVAGGIASLGSDGKVPSWQLPTVKAESVSRYKHHVKFTFVSSTYNGSFFTDIYSNQNTVIDSLATLKTYLGNEFTKDLYGYLEYHGSYRLGSLVTDTTIFYIDGGIKTQPISYFIISDTVTTI